MSRPARNRPTRRARFPRLAAGPCNGGAMVELYCDGCSSIRAFEQPPCRERHERGFEPGLEIECPEWLCTRCTVALLINPPRPRRRVRFAAARAA